MELKYGEDLAIKKICINSKKQTQFFFEKTLTLTLIKTNTTTMEKTKSTNINQKKRIKN